MKILTGENVRGNKRTKKTENVVFIALADLATYVSQILSPYIDNIYKIYIIVVNCTISILSSEYEQLFQVLIVNVRDAIQPLKIGTIAQ